MAAHRHRRLWRRIGLSAATLFGIVALLVGVSLIGAAATPGNQSFEAKWADWLRSHHAATFANALEQYYYNHHTPPKGGQPKTLNALPPSLKPTAGLASVIHLPPPQPIPLVVSPTLPREGQWQAVGPTVGGVPTMYEAQFRADAVYTSQITTAVWIDPTSLRLSLIPGTQEPGGTWTHRPYIEPDEVPAAVAAFNGGFRMSDAHGGFYLNGRTAHPLQVGAASIVIYSGGRIDIGAWGSEVSMTPKVVAVLQNLVPIVDGGQTAPDATYSDARIWGFTLGSKTVVARSGIGVTADGALVYVAGPALTARSLAESLKRAGAVRAMALDINPEWVTFNFYEHEAGYPVTGVKLYPQMQRPADRYLPPVEESRDFFLVTEPLAGSAN